MKLLRYTLILACFVPLFIFRDFTPNNELKYLSIADEAIRNGHFLSFWNHGAAYADKPPLYFWIIMLGKWLLGTHSMFFLALFSMIPAIVILDIMDRWTAPFLSPRFRNCGQLMLITTGLFLGSAIVVRMDMLMCMFILLSLYTFYKIYTGISGKSDPILLPVYIFLAVFSKGPVGALVPLLSITAFLLFQGKIREFGKYLGWKQWTILSALCILWFTGVYAEGGQSYLNNLLFNQTMNRAVNAFHHKAPLWYYLKTIWYSLAPWSLFYIVTIAIGIRKKILQTDIEKLFLTTILTTFICLSLFSSKLDIYMLPIFPFIAYLALLIVQRINERYVYPTIAIPAIVLALAFPGIFIAAPWLNPDLSAIPATKIAAFILSASSVLSLLFLFRKNLPNAANSLSVGLLAAILIGAFTIRQLNSFIGFRTMAIQTKNIAEKKDIKNFYYYQFRSGENIDVYLEKEINNISISQLSEIIDREQFILLIRKRDIDHEIKLSEITKNREIYDVGNYSIVIFYLN